MSRYLLKTAVLLVVMSIMVGAASAQTIGWANLQWPPSYTGSSCSGVGIYGQIWIDGVTSNPGQTPGLSAQLGFGTPGSTPDDSWLWIDAVFNVDAGNNDEFVVYLNNSIPVGLWDYGYRYRLDGDTAWYYADLNGPAPSGYVNPGVATITESCGPAAIAAVSWSAVKALYR